MPSNSYYFIAIAVAAAVTFLLRVVPFGIKSALAKSQLVVALATWIPLGAMVVLALYAIGDADYSTVNVGMPYIIATIVTIAVHLWRKNFMVTLIAGTLTCVVLTNWIFV